MYDERLMYRMAEDMVRAGELAGIPQVAFAAEWNGWMGSYQAY